MSLPIPDLMRLEFGFSKLNAQSLQIGSLKWIVLSGFEDVHFVSLKRCNLGMEE